MKNENKIGLDTIIGVGKKKKIAGREYYILPVCIKDMIYVIGNGIENDEVKTLVIVDKESLDKEEVTKSGPRKNITGITFKKFNRS